MALPLGLRNAVAVVAEDTGEVKKLEPVLVTGSNIPTLEAEPVAPVTRISREDIDRSGAVNVAEVLRNIPQNSGGSYGENNPQSFNPGSANVSLRGLGAQSTLVLINGRRIAPYAFAQNINGVSSSFVDLNSIPLGAVERIEVLKDSGSAIYGSDAVAGVVNIILRQDYEGVLTDALVGNTFDNDMFEQQYTFLGGLKGEKHNMMFFTDYYDRHAQFLRDRAISANANHTKNPAGNRFDFRSSVSELGFLLDPVTFDRLYVPLSGATSVGDLSPDPFDDGSAKNGNSFYNFNRDVVDWPETTRYGGYLVFNYDFTEQITGFIEAGYRNIRTHNEIAPTPIFGDTDGITIGPDNPYNPYNGISPDPIFFRRRMVEAGQRINDQDTDVVRFLPGVNIKVNENWNVSSAFLYSMSKTHEDGRNYLSLDATQAALNSTNPATALNPFVGLGPNNQALIDSLKVKTTRDAKNELYIYDLKGHGALYDLPAGALALALGGETRYETLRDVQDSLSEQLKIISQGGNKPVEGEERWSDALYAELSIPVFSSKNEKFLLTQLELQLAGRFEYYEGFGTTEKPKVGLKWAPHKDVFLRGSYSRGFRAPTLAELFLANVGFQDALIDEARCPDPTDTSDPDCGTTQYKIFSGGNPDLSPEDSESFYLGTTYEPQAGPLKGLSVSVDYSHINVYDVIQATDPQDALSLPLADQTGLVIRNPPSATDIANGEPGEIQYINSQLRNLASRKVDTVDLEVRYNWETGKCGLFTFDVNGSYLINWQEQFDSTSPHFQYAGSLAYPKIRGNGSVFWTYKRWSLGPTVNYIGDYMDQFGVRRVREFVSVDAQVTYQAPWQTTITFGVTNIGDEPAPFHNQSEGYDTQTHDNIGRSWYFKVSKVF
jgi:outer membrane receptor protein involved in Fe transport